MCKSQIGQWANSWLTTSYPKEKTAAKGATFLDALASLDFKLSVSQSDTFSLVHLQTLLGYFLRNQKRQLKANTLIDEYLKLLMTPLL